MDDSLARRLRGFGPLGILAFLIILALGPFVEPLGAILVLVWVKWSRTPWREIGYVQPKSWAKTVVGGLVFGSMLKFLLKAIVMPLLGASPINQAFHYLAGNTDALPQMAFDMIAGAGFGEETVYRGFLFERLRKLLGTGASAKITIVLISAALFGLIHYPVQGRDGATQAAIVGLVFGTIFAVTGRIWMLMVAHAAFDLTALALIYWNLESAVAHFVFK